MLRLAKNLAVFDSKGPAFWSPFCVFTKICNPTVPCARFRKLISKWTLPTWIVKAPSPTCRLWFCLISLTFCNGNYHCWRSNRESIDRLAFCLMADVLFVEVDTLQCFLIKKQNKTKPTKQNKKQHHLDILCWNFGQMKFNPLLSSVLWLWEFYIMINSCSKFMFSQWKLCNMELLVFNHKLLDERGKRIREWE